MGGVTSLRGERSTTKVHAGLHRSVSMYAGVSLAQESYDSLSGGSGRGAIYGEGGGGDSSGKGGEALLLSLSREALRCPSATCLRDTFSQTLCERFQPQTRCRCVELAQQLQDGSPTSNGAGTLQSLQSHPRVEKVGIHLLVQ